MSHYICHTQTDSGFALIDFLRRQSTLTAGPDPRHIRPARSIAASLLRWRQTGGVRQIWRDRQADRWIDIQTDCEWQTEQIMQTDMDKYSGRQTDCEWVRDFFGPAPALSGLRKDIFSSRLESKSVHSAFFSRCCTCSFITLCPVALLLLDLSPSPADFLTRLQPVIWTTEVFFLWFSGGAVIL